MAYPSNVQDAYRAELNGIREKGIFKQERFIHSPQAADISVEFPAGQPPKRVVNLCSNNYLGLSSHPEVVAAAHRGLDERGYGMSSVRFICGTQDLHRQLEAKLTEFLGTEDTILFPSCMDANGGVFEAVLNDQDVMIADRLVHASIVDGMRLCKAMQDTYKHADMKHLEQKLQEHQDKRVRLIITDGVFSMDGDLAPLDEICALAEKYNALVFVDDSHGSGFMGKTGRGVHEHFGVMGKIDILTTTLGKALGGASGGCVSGRKEIVELCRQRARPYLFSNAVPPPIAAAASGGTGSRRTRNSGGRRCPRPGSSSRTARAQSCRSCCSTRS
jgi:glycine C-acetyltransferase